MHLETIIFISYIMKEIDFYKILEYQKNTQPIVVAKE